MSDKNVAKIHPFHKSCTFLLQNGALWDMALVHCGICATGLLSYAKKLIKKFDIVVVPTDSQEELTHLLPREKMVAFSQTIFSYAFS